MPDYADALLWLSQIRRKSTSDEEWSEFVALIIEACGNAAAWRAEDDPSEIERRRHSDFVEFGLPSMLAATRKLRHLTENESYRSGFDDLASAPLKSVGITSDILRSAGHEYDASQHQAGPFLRRLLAALEGRLETELSPRERTTVGNQARNARRHILGPLRLPKPIGKRTPDARFTGLTFQLVFYIRRYTGEKKTRAITMLDRLPSVGLPRYDVVAQFTKAALGKFSADNGHRFEKALASNQAGGGRVTWLGWTSSRYLGGTKGIESFFVPDDD
jgi:hypothetical protein